MSYNNFIITIAISMTAVTYCGHIIALIQIKVNNMEVTVNNTRNNRITIILEITGSNHE